jgi:hypothetical protein
MKHNGKKRLLLSLNHVIIRILELEKELLEATTTKECLEIVGQMKKLELYLNDNFNEKEQGI